MRKFVFGQLKSSAKNRRDKICVGSMSEQRFAYLKTCAFFAYDVRKYLVGKRLRHNLQVEFERFCWWNERGKRIDSANRQNNSRLQTSNCRWIIFCRFFSFSCCCLRRNKFLRLNLLWNGAVCTCNSSSKSTNRMLEGFSQSTWVEKSKRQSYRRIDKSSQRAFKSFEILSRHLTRK